MNRQDDLALELVAFVVTIALASFALGMLFAASGFQISGSLLVLNPALAVPLGVGIVLSLVWALRLMKRVRDLAQAQNRPASVDS